jgi:hypothetical protein
MPRAMISNRKCCEQFYSNIFFRSFSVEPSLEHHLKTCVSERIKDYFLFYYYSLILEFFRVTASHYVV